MPLSLTGGKTDASTPTTSNKPKSQVPVRRETRPVVLAIDRSAVRTPVNSAHHRSGTSNALTPSDFAAAPAESKISRMRKTVLMCWEARRCARRALRRPDDGAEAGQPRDPRRGSAESEPKACCRCRGARGPHPKLSHPCCWRRRPPERQHVADQQGSV